ncbi:conserved hypothetical protein [Actinacidiphila bryophytorum]|uniref:Uncharacterized protein n=2 Tax=Actinacidiphila bryophytorum TaxID=1436133 RepID=A0A9W4MKC2_9ACTN|nr:conserved hypothetical protein [Actinacidiphila bryophytorum]
MGRPDGGGDFSGIDPQKLWDLINSMKNKTGYDGNGSAAPQVNGWMGQANRIGLDTSRLSTINRHFSWAQGQLPMLRRRQSLAANEAKEQGDFGQGSGMVGAGANDLGNFPTSEAAAKAGQDDAKKFKDGKISLQDYLKLIQANQYDPDYAKASATELGQYQLTELLHNSAALDFDHPDLGRAALANFVANAMRAGVDFKDRDGNEPLSLLSGLVNKAVFPADVLTNLADQCLAPGNTMYSDEVWKALAADPKAATQFVHDNIEYLPEFMKANSEHTGGLVNPYVKDFAAVLEAGMIGGPGADPKLAADNTTKLVTYYSSHDNHTHPEMQQVFADVIVFYGDDVKASLTDPFPVDLGPGHVSVPNSAWEGFIHESMQNPNATAELLAFSKDMANSVADSDPDNPAMQNAAGLIEGTFGFEATKVYQEMKDKGSKEANTWQSTVASQLSTVLGTGVDIAFDPGAVVKTVSKAAIKDVLNLFSTHIVKISADQMGDPPSTATWRDDWSEAAHQSYMKNHNLGNPQQYAQIYSGGKPFLTDDGHLVENATAGQKEAYNQWLKDPAVANALDKAFLNRDLGRLGSMTGVH